MEGKTFAEDVKEENRKINNCRSISIRHTHVLFMPRFMMGAEGEGEIIIDFLLNKTHNLTTFPASSV
jgi:hypothetical protein